VASSTVEHERERERESESLAALDRLIDRHHVSEVRLSAPRPRVAGARAIKEMMLRERGGRGRGGKGNKDGGQVEIGLFFVLL